MIAGRPVAPGQSFALKDSRFRPRSDEVFANEFGVAADGTDQTANIERALTHAVAESKVLVFPPGEYRCEAVDVPAGAKVRGFGATTTLKRRAGATLNRVLNIRGDGVLIADLTLDGNGSASGTANDGVVHVGTVGLSDITVERCHITNAYDHALRIIDTAGRVRIANNLIDDFGVNGSGGVGLLMNSQSSGAPTTISGVEIVGNTFLRHTNNTTGYGCLVRGSDNNTTRLMRDVRVIGNEVDLSNSTSGLGLEVWASHLTMANNITRGGGFGLSIAGSYVTIIGNEVSVASGCGIEAAATTTSNYVTCVGNTVSDSGVGIAAWGSANFVTISSNVVEKCEPAIHCFADDSTVTGNIIGIYAATGTVTMGIWFQGGKRVACSANRIRPHADNLGTNLTGVQFSDSEEFACTGNVINGMSIGVDCVATNSEQNGTVVGNDLFSCSTPIRVTTSGTGTTGNVQRWANRGVLPTVSGSAGANAALVDLLAELATLGVITNSSS